MKEYNNLKQRLMETRIKNLLYKVYILKSYDKSIKYMDRILSDI